MSRSQNMDQISDQLLHFIKGVGPHAFSNYLQHLTKDVKDWCPFANHKDDDAINCYAQDEGVRDLIHILKRYQKLLEFVEDDPYLGENFKQIIQTLNDPTDNLPIEHFKTNVKMIIASVYDREDRIYKNLRQLTCIECTRLDEAVICQADNCFLASTVMAVSATEARLHYLVRKKSERIYLSYFENATLGKLIELFDNNKYKEPKFKSLKSLVPKKHKSLLDMFNNYRIISAHPKISSLDHKVSKAILNLAFSFLLDPEVKITEKKLLEH